MAASGDAPPSRPPPWQALKLAGNDAYAAGRVEESLAAYTSALSFSGEPPLPALERATLLCNRAQVQLRLGAHEAAADDCTACLTITPSNYKALFRRGTAREALGDARGALKDFRDVLQLSPALADAIAAVRRLETALGEPSSLGGGGNSGVTRRDGSSGGSGSSLRDAISPEDARAAEDAQARVKEVAMQKAKARESQASAAREKRQLELSLGQVETLPADTPLFRPIGKMFMASPRPELMAVLGDKLARADKKLSVCAAALTHIERQEAEADGAFLEALATIRRKEGGGGPRRSA